MPDLFDWLSANPLATNVVIGAFSLLVVAIVVIYLVAFFQDREISIWPLKIGERPQKTPDAKTSSSSKSPPEIIKDFTERHYLVENGFRFHIPDPRTFEYLGEYFGFWWTDAKAVGQGEIEKFPTGRNLPSILPHCAKHKSTELMIHKALWGAKGLMRDVTPKIRGKVSAGRIDLKANTDTLSDPIQEKKWLIVAYSFNGEIDIQVVAEEETLSIP